MSSSDLAISVRGLGKSYTIRHQHESHITLAEQALSRIRHPLRRPERETFWALDDVNFDVHKGEVLGIIGRNGAGKSTLLKVLSRITAPTKGEVRLYGRIGSLLEVGTGFHPELTGRENVYLNGSILGMKTKEIDAQFDAIVDFAGVEKFLDTPVKRYSSGMYVRLAFAVAAHLETEILLDEVLAVGDADFQKKCLGKMGEVARGGRTILLVSHQLALHRGLAHRALLLEQGHLIRLGDIEEVADAYDVSASTSKAMDLRTAPRGRWALTRQLRLSSTGEVGISPGATPGECRVALQIDVERLAATDSTFGVVASFHDQSGRPVATAVVDSLNTPHESCSYVLDIAALLKPGVYDVTLMLSTANPRHGYLDHDMVENCITVAVLPEHVGEVANLPWGPYRMQTSAGEVKADA